MTYSLFDHESDGPYIAVLGSLDAAFEIRACLRSADFDLDAEVICVPEPRLWIVALEEGASGDALYLARGLAAAWLLDNRDLPDEGRALIL